MPTKIETDDGVITMDTYCPTCGGDAVPLLGRDCDCSLPEDVLCSAVIEHPDWDEPIRTTLTWGGDVAVEWGGGVAVDSLIEAALRGFIKSV